MKKSHVISFLINGQKTAAFIVGHAKWRKSRGLNPSENFAGERNPRKALNIALVELATHVAKCGSSIGSAAEVIVANARLTERKSTTMFNGIEVIATPDSTVDSLVAFYMKETQRRSEEYRQSPAGKQSAVDALDRQKKMQEQVDKALDELLSLDFSNLSDVIAWFGKIQEPPDFIHVKTPVDQIVPLFEKHGYEADANCGDDYVEDDMDNAGRYLVGQALSCLKSMGAIHQIYPSFEEKLRERFAA